jgi:hypothetical protein
MRIMLSRARIAISVVGAAWALVGCSTTDCDRNDRKSMSASGSGTLNHPVGHSGKEARMHTHAKATITVLSSETKPYDQTTGPALKEVLLKEVFTGEIEGESTVRALQVQQSEHSANMVSMQRFRGQMGGRRGTFVLQGQEIVQNGKIKASWFVVPGSGTEQLSGLRGEGGFEGEFGKGSEGTLDYWFE